MLTPKPIRWLPWALGVFLAVISAFPGVTYSADLFDVGYDLDISETANRVGSGAPSSFELLFPDPDERFFFNLPPVLFDWEDSIDPQGGAVTYNFVLRTCGEPLCEPSEIAFVKIGLTVSSLAVSDLSHIPFGISNSWTVEAVDPDGHVTRSDPRKFSFFIGNANVVQRLITGLVISDRDAARIVAANIRSDSPIGTEVYAQQSQSDGSFNLLIYLTYPPGVQATPEIELIESEISAAEYETLRLILSAGSNLAVPVVARMVDFVDSDGDGLSDNEELATYRTDPTDADSDGDGLTDSEEIKVHRTNPLEADTDEDGVFDGVEVASGTDPNFNPVVIVLILFDVLRQD